MPRGVKGSGKSKSRVKDVNGSPADAKTVTKIQGLLAMAKEGSGATDAERDAFLRKAMQLMAAAQLEMADVLMDAESLHEGTTAIEHRDYPIFVKNKFEVKEWRAVVGHAVARAFMCKSYNLGTSRVMVVGRAQDLDVFEQIWYSLLNQMTEAVKQASADKIFRQGAKGADDPVAYRKTFLEAAAGRLSSRLSSLINDVYESSTSDTSDPESGQMTEDNVSALNAIMVVTGDQIDAYVNANWKVGKGKQRSYGNGAYNYEAAEAGHRAADAAHIGTALPA